MTTNRHSNRGNSYGSDHQPCTRLEKRLAVRWQAANRDYLAANRRARDVAGGLGAVSRALRMILQSAMLAVGALLVIEGSASGGVMIASSVLMGRALAPIDIARNRRSGAGRGMDRESATAKSPDRQDLKAEVGAELRTVQGEIGEFSERRVNAEDLLKRIDIRAPQSGMVHKLSVQTVGGVIALGDLALLPGMPAEAFVRTGERTALSSLVKPLSDQVRRAFRED